MLLGGRRTLRPQPPRYTICLIHLQRTRNPHRCQADHSLGLGQRLDLEDLRSTTSRIDAINVTDEIPGARDESGIEAPHPATATQPPIRDEFPGATKQP